MTTQPPPTILIDASDIDRPSGGRTAVLELFRVLFARESGWEYIVLVSQQEPDFGQYPYVRQIVIPHCNRIIERVWIQAVITYFTMVKNVDIVHFARTMGGIAWLAKSVLTIFDMTVLHYPEFHSRSAVWFWRYLQPLFIKWSDQIIAISQTVKEDLVQEFGILPEKIKVVYCAPKSIFQKPVDPRLLEHVSQKYHLPKRYMLFVGLLAKKKNLLTLFRALHLLKQQQIDYPPLVIVGRRYSQSDDVTIFQQIRSLGLESDIQYIGPVEDEELPSLYRGAEVFVFPSLEEGFGIPCLEAMMCRVPVVTTRGGAIPEIVGDAALLVDDPTNENTLAQALHQLLSDELLRQTLIARGITRVENFSWPQFSDQVLDLYRFLLDR
jgi:glycosyltransferase involved in cell wall biosynthesis